MSEHAPIVYFHGMPGGPDEWIVNAPSGARAPAATDRNNAPLPATASAPPEGAVVIGFSLGAVPAMRLAAQWPERIAHLHLVSPAAPLQLGDFLPDMAGGQLFRMARDRPRLFRFVARLERLVARIAPRFLMRQLMAGAAGGDRFLARDPRFVDGMAGVLRNGLGCDHRGFAAEVTAYAGDWRGILASIGTPSTIWQGEADNWTPASMGQALHRALPGSTLRQLPGLSHYSTLRAALDEIT